MPEVFIMIKCDEPTEMNQKYQACGLVEQKVKRIKGVKKTFFIGMEEADLTAFAKWSQEDIKNRVREIEAIQGINEAKAKVIVPA